MKPPHQTDIRDSAMIDKAAYFVASIFLGTGQFDKCEQFSLDAARSTARKMGKHYQNGRLGMVYAVLPDGRSIFVPDTYQPKEIEMTETNTNEIPDFMKRDKTPKQPAAKGNGVSAKRKPAAKIGKAKNPAAVKETKAVKAKAVKALKPAKATKPTKAANAPRKATGQRAAIAAAAAEGKLPTPPDFSAESHSRYRPKLDELVKMAKAGDVAGLRAFEIKPYSSSPKAMDRYRNLAVTALEARTA